MYCPVTLQPSPCLPFALCRSAQYHQLNTMWSPNKGTKKMIICKKQYSQNSVKPNSVWSHIPAAGLPGQPRRVWSWLPRAADDTHLATA